MEENRLRATSAAIFQNSYFVEVAVAIARHPKERFIQKDLVSATGIDKGLVATVISRLKPSGLIEPIPEPGRERPFKRVPSVFWQLVIALYDELHST